MSLVINRYCLANTPYREDSITQAFRSYGELISRAFHPLPSNEKICELIKRIGVIAAPLIYPLLWMGVYIVNAYYKVTRSHVFALLDQVIDQAKWRFDHVVVKDADE